MRSRKQVEELTGGKVGKGHHFPRSRKRAQDTGADPEVCLRWEDEVVLTLFVR